MLTVTGLTVATVACASIPVADDELAVMARQVQAAYQQAGPCAESTVTAKWSGNRERRQVLHARLSQARWDFRRLEDSMDQVRQFAIWSGSSRDFLPSAEGLRLRDADHMSIAPDIPFHSTTVDTSLIGGRRLLSQHSQDDLGNLFRWDSEFDTVGLLIRTTFRSVQVRPWPRKDRSVVVILTFLQPSRETPQGGEPRASSGAVAQRILSQETVTHRGRTTLSFDNWRSCGQQERGVSPWESELPAGASTWESAPRTETRAAR